MIDLKHAVREHVHIQFKRGLLYIGARDGHMGPLQSRPPTRGPNGEVQANESPPIIVDQIDGVLHEHDGQFFVTYPNPATEGEYINMYIDPENVAAAWTVASLVVATPDQVHQTT